MRSKYKIRRETLVSYIGDESCVTVPSNVKRIEPFAFTSKYADTIHQIVLGPNIKYIDDYAFVNCENLESIIISDKNRSYTSVDGVLFDYTQTKLLLYPRANRSIHYSVPTTVTAIADYAFESSEYLEDIIIPSSVTKIGVEAFKSCKSLKHVTMLGSNVDVMYGAFLWCSNLSSMVTPNGSLQLSSNVFDGTKIEMK